MMSSRFYRITLPAMGCVTAFLVWAALASIDESVKGFGKVITSGQNRTLSHLEGGIVSQIMVTEGNQVRKGQILLRVENQGFLSESEEVSIELLSAELRRLRLQAELKGDTSLIYDKTLARRVGEQEVAQQIQLFNSRRREFKESLDVLRQQQQQKEYKIIELEQKVSNISAELQVAREQYNVAKNLYQSGAYSKNKYLDAKSKLQSFITQLRSTQTAIPTIRSELEEISRRIKQMHSERNSEILEELNDLRVTIDRLGERSKNANDRVSRTEIISPVNGIVNKLHVNTIGSVVKAGAPILEITPLDDELVIEAEIATKDRARIWPGQDVVIRISAFDYTIHGSLSGKVSTISADSFSSDTKEPYYNVKIIPDATMLNNQHIIPGMSADINIVTGKRTILRYLVKPLTRMKHTILIEP